LGRRLRAFADLNFRIVDVCQHLTQIAHGEERAVDRANAEVIGLGFCDAVRVDDGLRAGAEVTASPRLAILVNLFYGEVT
jgi:hypothetical protein